MTTRRIEKFNESLTQSVRECREVSRERCVSLLTDGETPHRGSPDILHRDRDTFLLDGFQKKMIRISNNSMDACNAVV